MEEDVPLAQVSLLFMENCFQILHDTDGEDDAYRIIIIVPPLLLFYF